METPDYGQTDVDEREDTEEYGQGLFSQWQVIITISLNHNDLKRW